MNIDEIKPKPQERIEFELKKNKVVTTESGCYILTNFNGEILYIGQAANLQKRMKDHLNDPNKNQKTYLGKVFWFYFLQQNPTKLNKLERGWLNLFELKEAKLPVLNSVHAPI